MKRTPLPMFLAAQRVERIMINATARWLQLTGRAEPPMPRDERERMRDVIEAMRPIAYAAIEHVFAYRGNRPPSALQKLYDVVDADRERMFAAMSNWPDSQTWSEAERMRPVVQAAIAWYDTDDETQQLRYNLMSAVEAYGAYSQPFAAVSPKTLTPNEWSALLDLCSVLRSSIGDSAITFSAQHRGRIVTAIDKLRHAAYANSEAGRAEAER